MKSKGMSGERLGEPPYGYMKIAGDKKRWMIDEPAAEIVRKVYDLCIGGKDHAQIAKILRKEKVLTVKSHYGQMKGKSFAISHISGFIRMINRSNLTRTVFETVC